MLDFLMGLGVIGILMFLILIPIVATIIVGSAIASYFGFTGIVWWAFMIVFYLIVTSLMSLGAKR